jgi:peptide/nickel transport system permease protein
MTTSSTDPKETPPVGGQVADLAPKARTIRQQGLWAMAWGRLRKHKLAMIGLFLMVTIILMVVLADIIAPYSYEEIDLNQSFSPLFAPGAEGRPIHILGTDRLGRDIFSRIVFAGRISLFVALIVTALDVINGTIIGSVSGSFGGSVDTVLMRNAHLAGTAPLVGSIQQFAPICPTARVSGLQP